MTRYNPKGRYANATQNLGKRLERSKEPWSHTENSTLLEALCTQIEHPYQFNPKSKILAELAHKLFRGSVKHTMHRDYVDAGPIVRHVYGLCVGAVQYIADPAVVRTTQTGPLTWFERHCVGLAVNGTMAERGSAIRPTPAYLATILNRPVEDIEAYWKRLRPPGLLDIKVDEDD